MVKRQRKTRSDLVDVGIFLLSVFLTRVEHKKRITKFIKAITAIWKNPLLAKKKQIYCMMKDWYSFTKMHPKDLSNAPTG